MSQTNEKKICAGEMRTIKLGGVLEASQVALGMMRIRDLSVGEIERFIKEACAQGINFFEHADVYGAGLCEEKFGAVLHTNPSLRGEITLQTKCGMRPGMLDSSKEHIINSVEGSLRRLQTEQIDLLALHRPDILVEPEEVAEAFDLLHRQGKVRYFGVSNHTAGQIALLQKHLNQPLLVNQMQFSLLHTPMIDAGLHANLYNEFAPDRDGGVLDYCRLHDISLQAWSPFQYGFFKGVFIDHPDFPEVNAVLAELAEIYGVDKTAIALAFLHRHPAGVQTVAGTTKVERLPSLVASARVQLTRAEWYKLYLSAGNKIP